VTLGTTNKSLLASSSHVAPASKDESGRLLLSRTAVCELGERLWEDYQAFAQRDLSEYEIAYLFVDGIAERLRAGAECQQRAEFALKPAE
jgi:transposase-like protein